MAANTCVLSVERLSVSYHALKALDDLSWAVHGGEILGIIGPNGAGKSSCFAAITNMVPHEGEVYLADERLTGLPAHQLFHRGLRRTYQQNAFFGELTVVDNMVGALLSRHSTPLMLSVLAPWLQAARRREAEAVTAGILEEFGIPGAYHHSLPADIPYGIQRLLSIALAYGSGARALLLDEPAAGLGGTDMQRLADLLVRLRGEGVALVVIEHHMDLIMAVADRIVVIDQGRWLAEGTPAQIRQNDAVREAYLGRSV